MDSRNCDECGAIRQELREAWEAARARSPDQGATPRQLADWVQQLDAEECARVRATSSLWKVWRRLRQHQALTGHVIALSHLPPDAISNPN